MKQGPTTVIEIDPEILSGTPVFAGTRVPAETLLNYLEGGRSLADFLADYPAVTEAQAIAALGEAKVAWLARARRADESVVDLLDAWLDEDASRDGGMDAWNQLKHSLDRHRLSERRLFP